MLGSSQESGQRYKETGRFRKLSVSKEVLKSQKSYWPFGTPYSSSKGQIILLSLCTGLYGNNIFRNRRRVLSRFGAGIEVVHLNAMV